MYAEDIYHAQNLIVVKCFVYNHFCKVTSIKFNNHLKPLTFILWLAGQTMYDITS